MHVRRLVSFTLAAALASGCETARDVQQYTVADFYENDQYFGASFSPDKSRLLVTSNMTGVYNAYTIPVEGGEPLALTESTDDAIRAISFFPNDDRILYLQDDGGNELDHVFVRDPDGAIQDITPGENLKATFAGWADDEQSFFVETNERDARFFDLYEHDVDTYERSLVYENNEGYSFGGVSPDRRYLALVKPYTTSDLDIFLHDRQAGTTTNITEHTGSVANAPADFTPDGSALLFVSDRDREFAALHRYDIQTGEATQVLAPDWDVVGASYTRSGQYLRVTVNEEAKIQTHVYHAANMEPLELRGLPDGLVRSMQFSKDDSYFAFYATDGSTPDDLWCGPTDGNPTRLTNALSVNIDRNDLVAPQHVWFTSYDGVEIPGLLYKPHQASRSARAPAMVMVHGGPGGQATVGYRAMIQALVNHGYVVFDINNRGSSGYGKSFYKMDDQAHGEADLGDVVASKQMLSETGYVDPDRIGIIGGSYGGYMVLAALTLQPDEFAVGVDLFGISNWIRTLTSIPPWWESFREALYEEMGNPATDSVRLHRISPLFNAAEIRSPLMVLQGANDPRVLQVESDEIVAAARAQGVPVEYLIFPDEGHGFVKKENEIEGYTAVIEFLDRHLKGTGAM
ncbi:MAG: hypothetical protein AMS18_13035 [Gemmatimonas sp. SG8_17]|nr:MAG: hypothetical protein AMS18_13035 [Gemmatimonas sp. SG8_17]